MSKPLRYYVSGDDFDRLMIRYARDQLGRTKPKSFEAWAITNVVNPQPLLDWHAKHSTK